MKFGLHLSAHLTPEWSCQYIEYEYMKELLEQATAKAPNVVDNDDHVLREQFFLEVDIEFFQVRKNCMYQPFRKGLSLCSPLVLQKAANKDQRFLHRKTC